MRNGKGTYHFGEKDSFKGKWQNNLPHGEGVLTLKNKKVEGEFRFGKFIKEKSGEEATQKKSKKDKKSSDNGKHKHHKHNHDKNHSKKSKSKINDESDNNKSKNKDDDSNSANDKKPVEIDGIPGICVKKMK